jgi:8-oxo-dGTP diphosphatase
MEARVTVEEYVGLRIRKRREELEMSAVEFGSEVGLWLGEPWPRQAVSAAELGKRSLGAAELVAIAHVLQTSPTYLLAPPAGIGEITMPSGATINRDLLFSLVVVTTPDSDVNLAAEQALSALTERAVRGQEDAAEIVRLARDLHLLITRHVIIVGPEHKVVTPEEFRRGQPHFTEVPQGSEEDTAAMQPVVTAIVTSDRGVLVGQRRDGKPPWTFIAGEQRLDERPEQTAEREVKEEAGGLKVHVGEKIGERVHPKTGRLMIYMAARPTHGTEVVVGNPVELTAVDWVSLAKADELMADMFGPVREHLARELGEAIDGTEGE